MLELKKADIKLYEDLKTLFRTSFSLEKSEVDFFFENKFNPDNCVVCLKDGKLTSALHMFYNNLICRNSKKIKAYYLYGAATFPEYRNQGFMTKTINFANNLALKKECEYSILLPANDSLVRFYEKIGYRSFFKTNFLKFTFDKLKRVTDFENFYNKEEFKNFEHNVEKFDYLSFEKIREKFYNSLYDVCWDEESIKFAMNSNDYYSKRNIKTVLREKSYAICCYEPESDIIQILEIALADAEDLNELKFLICNILNLMQAKEYIFRVPVGRLNFLEEFCDDKKIKNWGMIKSLTCEKINLLNVKNTPYLGLTLD